MHQRKIICLSALLSISTLWAQSESPSPRFQSTANGADVITPIGGKGVFGLGIYAETMYPLGRSFSSDTGALDGNQQDMRFQIPVGFGLEASYGITRKMEVALSGGFDYFKTQNFRFQSGGEKIYDEAKYRLFPVVGIFRYRWPKRYWAPEAEAGIGAAFGSITVTAMKNPREKLTSNGPFYRGHIAGGTAFSWGEGASLHIQVGYGMTQLGKKTYTFSDAYTVQQEAFMQGIFIKSFLKFYF